MLVSGHLSHNILFTIIIQKVLSLTEDQRAENVPEISTIFS